MLVHHAANGFEDLVGLARRSSTSIHPRMRSLRYGCNFFIGDEQVFFPNHRDDIERSRARSASATCRPEL